MDTNQTSSKQDAQAPRPGWSTASRRRNGYRDDRSDYARATSRRDAARGYSTMDDGAQVWDES